MATPEDFGRVGDLLGDFCETAAAPAAPEARPGRGQHAERPDGGAARGDTARTLAAAWPRIAGAEVAANAVPVQLKAGRLVVSTSSSVWAHTLQYMAHDLMSRLNEYLGPGAVKQIVFRHAGWEERPHGEAPAQREAAGQEPGELSQGQKDALAQLEGLDMPPAIREAMARAMKASFIRSQRDSVR
jgi:hypothetical protein